MSLRPPGTLSGILSRTPDRLSPKEKMSQAAGPGSESGSCCHCEYTLNRKIKTSHEHTVLFASYYADTQIYHVMRTRNKLTTAWENPVGL